MEIPTRFHFCHRVEVAFADTDLAGIVHFANFLRYAENTEHAFLRSIGLSVHTTEGARAHQQNFDGLERVVVAQQWLG